MTEKHNCFPDAIFTDIGEELNALYRFARLITAQSTLHDVCRSAVDFLTETLSLDTALIFLRDNNELFLKASGPEEHTHPVDATPVHHVGECLCGLAISTRLPIYVQDIYNDIRCTLNECKHAGFVSFAAIPLLIGDDSVGVLGAASLEKRDFTLVSSFLETAGNHLAISIHNARLLDENQAYAVKLEQSDEERNVAQQALKKNERLLTEIISATTDAFWEWDLISDNTYFSPRWYEMLGYHNRELPMVLDTWKSLCHPDDYPAVSETLKRAHESQGTIKYRAEYRMRAKNGSWMWILDRGDIAERAEDGTPLVMIGTHTNITERKNAEAIMLQQKNDYQGIIDSIPNAIIYYDREDRIIRTNKYTKELLGISIDSLIGKNVYEIFPQKLADKFHDNIRTVTHSGEPIMGIFEQLPTGSGVPFWANTDIIPYKSITGETIGAIVIVRDITELKKAELALIENERKYRALFENASIAIVMLNEMTIIDCNNMALKMFNSDRSQLIGLTPLDLSTEFQPDGALSAVKIGEIYETVSTKPSFFFEWKCRRLNGEEFDAELSINKVFDEGILFQCIIRDITERVTTESALKSSEAMLKSIFRTVPVGISILTQEWEFISVNESMVDILGYTKEEYIGRNTRFIYFSDEEYRAVGEKMYGTPRKSRALNVETRFRAKDGREVFAILSSSPLDPDDRSKGTIFAVLDISEHKRLETQFLQAQKMEAVGQLAGGVAHDFNNMLLVIQGFTDLVLSSLAENDENRGLLMEVRLASDRAAGLTRQLLAFSRRQVLKLDPLDMNEVVENLMKMMRRLIGENIELVVIPGHNLRLVNADRGQMEQVLLNLCVNARDAMPEGGRLIIESENVALDDEYCATHEWAKPGRHVMISVTDTGIGMDETVLRQIFEPFFTTKDVGKGTGLGLATVYGIVRQHGGMIQVYSEPGKGSRFRVYIPAIDRPSDTAVKEEQTVIAGGTETIILAEDEEQIRSLSNRILVQAGYTVLTAADGIEALNLYKERKRETAILILDVVMPHKGGFEVYEEIAAENHPVKCLFTSGYSQNAVDTDFIRSSGKRLLQKPYTNRDLLRAVRDILDEQ